MKDSIHPGNTLINDSRSRNFGLALTPAGRTTVNHATQAARDVDALFFGPDPTELRATLRNIAEHRPEDHRGSPTPSGSDG